jgi:hypothetical protein
MYHEISDVTPKNFLFANQTQLCSSVHVNTAEGQLVQRQHKLSSLDSLLLTNQRDKRCCPLAPLVKRDGNLDTAVIYSALKNADSGQNAWSKFVGKTRHLHV